MRNEVLLINLPWAVFLEPSLGLGILKAQLDAADVPCDVMEAQLDLLRWVTPKTYDRISEHWALCDFVFTGELDGGAATMTPERLDILKRVCTDSQGTEGHLPFVGEARDLYDKALTLRHEIVPAYLDDLMSQIDLDRYAMVGFTCLCDQTYASLALAKRIRALRPDIKIVWGGYALEAPIGPHLQSCFPDLMDAVAYGDGEPVIVPLYEAAMGQRSFADVPNISYRDEAGRIVRTPGKKIQLETSPTPDLDAFMHGRARLKAEHGVEITVPTLPLESSRGCWWGQKNHCVFCGIDDDTMRYREKSADRVLEQLDSLHARYGCTNFRFADYIMPQSYYHTLLPRLRAQPRPYKIQYEMKANIKPADMDLMKEAGIVFAQLGIESFSQPVLKRMKKGVSGLHNVRSIIGLMKRGINPYYNFLFGFPGDTAEEYRQMVWMLPALYHLKSPGTMVWVQITRFAPMAERPGDFGLNRKPRHHWRYELLFAPEYREAMGIDLDQLCYYYENYNRGMHDKETTQLFSVMQRQWWVWQERLEHGAQLSWREDGEGGVAVYDTRLTDTPQQSRLQDAEAALFRAVNEDIRTWNELVAELPYPEPEIRRAMDHLISERWVLQEGNTYLGVALPESVYRDGSLWWLDKELWGALWKAHEVGLPDAPAAENTRETVLAAQPEEGL